MRKLSESIYNNNNTNILKAIEMIESFFSIQHIKYLSD